MGLLEAARGRLFAVSVAGILLLTFLVGSVPFSNIAARYAERVEDEVDVAEGFVSEFGPVTPRARVVMGTGVTVPDRAAA